MTEGANYRRVSPFCVTSSNRKTLVLYMYVSQKALFGILQTGLLKLSKAWLTNDITEGVLQHEYTLRTLAKDFGYLCFTDKMDSVAMWGYYADRGKGACIVFHFDVVEIQKGLFEVLFDGMMDISHPIYIRKVVYSNVRAKNCTVYDSFFIKSEDWKHESEYRILFNLLDDRVITKENTGVIENYVSGFLSNIAAVVVGPRSKYEVSEMDSYIQGLGNIIHYISYAEPPHEHSSTYPYYSPLKYVAACKASLSDTEFKLDVSDVDIIDARDLHGPMPSFRDTLFLNDYIATRRIRYEMLYKKLEIVKIAGRGRTGFEYKFEKDDKTSLNYLLWELREPSSVRYLLCENNSNGIMIDMRSLNQQEKLRKLFQKNMEKYPKVNAKIVNLHYLK